MAHAWMLPQKIGNEKNSIGGHERTIGLKRSAREEKSKACDGEEGGRGTARSEIFVVSSA